MPSRTRTCAAREPPRPPPVGSFRGAVSARASIATAEQAADLSKRIEATQRILDKKREVASATGHVSSPVEHQQRFLSKAVAIFGSGSLKPTDFQDAGAEQSVNLAMALAGTGLPAMALFIAGLYRREDEADRTSPGKVTRTTSSYRPAPAQTGVVMHTTETIRDDGIRDALRAVARHRLPQLGVA